MNRPDDLAPAHELLETAFSDEAPDVRYDAAIKLVQLFEEYGVLEEDFTEFGRCGE